MAPLSLPVLIAVRLGGERASTAGGTFAPCRLPSGAGSANRAVLAVYEHVLKRRADNGRTDVVGAPVGAI